MGLDTLGSHEMDLGVCTHALHKMQTNAGLWPQTFQNYDKHNFIVAIIYFIISVFLNILILTILPPQFKYWYLYFFSFETPKAWRLGAQTYVSF